MREKVYRQVIEKMDLHLPRHYIIPITNIIINDEAFKGFRDSEKLAMMCRYKDADLSKFYITSTNLPTLFDAFIMGQDFNGLYLHWIEVGIDGMIFHATSTNIDISDDYRLIIPFAGASGVITISGHEGKEAYEIIWEGKCLKKFTETINNVYSEYELLDVSKREFRVTEQNPTNNNPLCAID